jgi:hypothetical protein
MCGSGITLHSSQAAQSSRSGAPTIDAGDVASAERGELVVVLARHLPGGVDEVDHLRGRHVDDEVGRGFDELPRIRSGCDHGDDARRLEIERHHPRRGHHVAPASRRRT